MPSWQVSSTIFGSIRIILTSSGVARASSDTSIELTKLDLPDPVEPATRRCAFREVPRDVFALNVFTQRNHQRMVVAARRRIGQHVGQPHHFPIDIGHLDADCGLAWDRRQHPDALGGHRVGDIAL